MAVTSSGIAGLIHVVAAVEHRDDRTLVLLFVASAVAQLAWAAGVAVRPTRPVLVAGIVLNTSVAAFWLVSRTTGVPMIGALRRPEVIGGQDLAAALLAIAAAAAAMVVLARPVPRTTLPRSWSVALGAAALVLFVPVLATGHTHAHPAGHDHLVAGAAHDHDTAAAGAHDHAGAASGDAAGHVHNGSASDLAHVHDPSAPGATHDHEATGTSTGHDHGSADGTSTGHDHGTSTDLTSGGHDHGDPGTPGGSPGHDHGDPADPTTPPGHDHTGGDPTAPSGPITSLDDPRLTPTQRAAAQHLIDITSAAMAAFPTVESVEQAGYTPIGDGGSDGYAHYVDWSYLSDGYELDPSHIEAIVVKSSSTGPKTVVSALYILSVGKTMADVPDIAGELTTWHIHTNLCFEGTHLVGLSDANGVCAAGNLLVTPPMLHVWTVEQPCGPFAGIDENGVECGDHHH